MNLDHQQVSELLQAYERGDLDPERTETVRLHLDDCPECRAELAGLRALAVLPEGELEPAERIALRDAVRVAARPRSRAARLAPALGALGLIAIVVLGATTILDSSDIVGGDTAVQQLPAGQAEDALEDGGGGDQAARAKERSDVASGTTANQGGGGRQAEENLTTESAAGPQPQALGAAAAVTNFFNAAPLSPDLFTDRDAFGFARRLSSLYATAPTDGWARQIQTCNQVATRFLPEDARAAYAQVFESDRILVMGFIWSEDDERHYAFWGWPYNDCSSVMPVHRSGTL